MQLSKKEKGKKAHCLSQDDKYEKELNEQTIYWPIIVSREHYLMLMV